MRGRGQEIENELINGNITKVLDQTTPEDHLSMAVLFGESVSSLRQCELGLGVEQMINIGKALGSILSVGARVGGKLIQPTRPLEKPPVFNSSIASLKSNINLNSPSSKNVIQIRGHGVCESIMKSYLHVLSHAMEICLF
jgi:hypothetical protein